MNYFEFYNLPEAFHIDAAAIKRNFYALSKQYHPDFYINESEQKQQEILDLSTLNNKAFQVLSDPVKRMHYILSEHGLLAEDEKYTLPQAFLMEMMDVNEALMELEFESDPAAVINISNQVAAIEEELASELDKLTRAADTVTASEKEPLLTQIKDLWYRQKYLLRIRESLKKFS